MSEKVKRNDRQSRLAAALRDNLRKRKAQSRTKKDILQKDRDPATPAPEKPGKAHSEQ